MPLTAIISDVHANLEALEAVLEDIDRQGIRDILCLGDVVGYGPDPVACTDLVRSRCRVTIRGNHDEALVQGAWGFNQHARDAIEWTRRTMKPRFYRSGSRRRWRFLASLPLTHEWDGRLLVHGSPRNPTSEYVLPRDAGWPSPGMFEEIFARFERVCLVGHTHIAGVFYEGPRFVQQGEIPGPFAFESSKMLINVGSVGQPRDQDPRACYLTVDTDQDVYQFRRVRYPVHITRRKILRNGSLDNRLGDRLEAGG